MERYDYRQAMLDDIREYIKNNYEQDEIRERLQDRDDFYEELNDKMWIDTFSTWTAEEYLCHNNELLMEAMEEFGCEPKDFQGAEWGDVTIRCYLLGQCLSEVLDELENELVTDQTEED